MMRAATTGAADLTGRGARTEVRSWYVDRLRPRLTEAVAAGVVEAAAAQYLDFELAELLGPPDDHHEEAA